MFLAEVYYKRFKTKFKRLSLFVKGLEQPGGIVQRFSEAEKCVISLKRDTLVLPLEATAIIYLSQSKRLHNLCFSSYNFIFQVHAILELAFWWSADI